jgi:hypothetical protein
MIYLALHEAIVFMSILVCPSQSLTGIQRSLNRDRDRDRDRDATADGNASRA